MKLKKHLSLFSFVLSHNFYVLYLIGIQTYILLPYLIRKAKIPFSCILTNVDDGTQIHFLTEEQKNMFLSCELWVMSREVWDHSITCFLCSSISQKTKLQSWWSCWTRFSICPRWSINIGSQWDPETSSGWHLEAFVISTPILGKSIQYLCLIESNNSLLFANSVAVPRLPDAIYLIRLFSHGFKNPRLFALTGFASSRRLWAFEQWAMSCECFWQKFWIGFPKMGVEITRTSQSHPDHTSFKKI